MAELQAATRKQRAPEVALSSVFNAHRTAERAAPRASSDSRFGHDFSRMPVHAEAAFASTDNNQLADTPAPSADTGPCGDPCGSFPWVQLTPKRWMSLCDDAVNLGTPSVPPISGCMPGRPGKVLFQSGGWGVQNTCAYCRPGAPESEQSKPDPTIQVGFIQTVERALQGGVYFSKVGNDWVNVDNIWFQIANQRDCLGTAKTDPWYGPDKDGNFGPQNFGDACPLMFDQPFVFLPTHKGGGTLRRMRIDGLFNLWMVAKVPGNKIVYIHHWTIDVLAVAVLLGDADPCNFSQWKVLLGGRNTAVTDKGPGQGPKTPVLTGPCAKSKASATTTEKENES